MSLVVLYFFDERLDVDNLAKFGGLKTSPEKNIAVVDAEENVGAGEAEI
jgi:hypothetical protein